jgi:hypothetical protein
MTYHCRLHPDCSFESIPPDAIKIGVGRRGAWSMYKIGDTFHDLKLTKPKVTPVPVKSFVVLPPTVVPLPEPKLPEPPKPELKVEPEQPEPELETTTIMSLAFRNLRK